MHHQPLMTPMPPVLLHGQATAWSVQALAAARTQPEGESFVVDASGLTQFDSSALAALLELRRGLQARQQGLRLVGAPGRLLELAALYGVTELLGT